MYRHMPPANPRKRAAPGSPAMAGSPMQQQQQHQAFNATSQMAWGQGPENMAYADPSAYNLNHNGAAMSQQQYDSSVPTASTQLARRPMNQHLVPTAARPPYDNSGDPWGQFGDDSLIDVQGTGGQMEETENIEHLEEKARSAKRDAQSKRKQIPPFVQKLSSFLDDGKNTDLIRWSERGDSFVVLDEDEFAKTLIPELFKHNNYASFVRQLNMYGFHKRVGLSDNSMKASERKNKTPSEYYNPYFKRGHPDLLWLINKPKGGNAKNKKRVKADNQDDVDSDDEGKEEEVYGGYPPMQATRAISVAPEAGQLQRRDLAIVQKEISEIQKSHQAISATISRLRNDQNNLYQQAVAFQTLHDRHESSINAILTFLATVYNRSLDGEGNIAQMFANVIPQNQQQHQGSVVDMGDVSNQQQQNPGSASPIRRQQRLLMAPPGGSANTVSSATTPQSQSATTPRPGAIEELFDSPSADTSHLKAEPEMPEQDMMSLIHNTNAANSSSAAKPMEFPEMLSHYENANGNSPLTPQQRTNMLSMIANQTSLPGSNNALVSPSPPLAPTLAAFNHTEAEIQQLLAMQNENGQRINRLNRAVTPLSPSVVPLSPSVLDGSYFDHNNSNLDLDQYLDPGAFYNGGSPMGGGDYAFNYGDGVDMGDIGLSMDGAADGLPAGGRNGVGEGRIKSIEETPSPEEVVEEVQRPVSTARTTHKRRRRN